MKVSKKRKDIIETLYMEYHGAVATLSGSEESSIRFLGRRFGLSRRQAQGLIDFVNYEGWALPSYGYYVDTTDIWDFYYDSRRMK